MAKFMEKKKLVFVRLFPGTSKGSNMKEYEKPSITTYSEEEILELIGPANTCGSAGLHEPHGHAWGWHRRHS
jgi:hypothetical protein